MQSVYACVVDRHDLGLVALAASICALGIYAAVALAREAERSASRRLATLWGAAATVSLASAIWSTHFLAMLAYEPGMATGFDVPVTVLSYVVALAFVGAGGLFLVRARTPIGRLGAGGVIGLAISAMHYTGMTAFTVQGRLAWDESLVAVSVASGVVLAALSVLAAVDRRSWRRHLAPPLLILAVCATHFVGMTAASLEFQPSAPEPIGSGRNLLVASLVANVAFVIVGLSLAAVWLSFRERRRAIAERTRLRDIADIAVEGLLICQEGRVVGANRSFELMKGFLNRDLVGRRLEEVVTGVAASAVPMGLEIEARIDQAADGPIPVRVIGRTLMLGGQEHLVVAVRDQRERLKTEAEILRLAHHDALTGVANRLTFNERLAALYASRRHGDAAFALITVDLDRFKWVNDTLGHGAGDEVLRRVARRLSAAVREHDVVARLGGDEFSIIATHASDLAAVTAVAERVVDLLSRPFLIGGKVVEAAASCGVAIGPADGETPEDLAAAADLALYQAKQQGGDGYRLFEPAMNARAQARRSLELDLRRAVARQEFTVHYQPQVDAATGAFDGAEALIRWRHETRGMVPPSDFIPLAEEIGLINQIGEWVLRAACTEAAAWPERLSISVNLSPVQLRDPRLPSMIAAILAETGLAPERLELEVTETALIQEEAAALAALTELQRLGARISMDDFGTGYSSLSHLRRFPFDKIKIDQSFVRQLPHDRDSAAIVQAITSLGAKLGLTVTAEGVETEEQLSFTVAEGCGQIQGYLISRPAPAEEIVKLFEGGRMEFAHVA
ncbi:MAG: bifunctional diguanylate cyclase/phosphodiesterase [Ancylobacter novellus]|uniref:Bifunctional diguanylate cyclase/phosphodiesterase n=1 Tax=Ancylobacter novellus TaxID=921 RepID=A0A2W5KMA0_ANCNO|nr:MAG: bifunctional diguanylate cyclase/phosphodiesterase [Ancylobacter novellus]